MDGELELVPPQAQWVDAVLAACAHPLSVREGPPEVRTSREQLSQFIQKYPDGHDPGDRGRVPQYHFWMHLRPDPGGAPPPVSMAGGIGLRVGTTQAIELYYGHIGYHVYPPARGHHYAERACRLLLPLARYHGLRKLWITCNPDNLASRRTCERLGATLVEIIPVPEGEALYVRGDYEKCRYRLDL